MVETASEFARLEQTLEERRLRVEAALRRLVASRQRARGRGGGRVEPVRARQAAAAGAGAARGRGPEGDPDAVLPAGCAIEMVHTASLILDDLPSMDDAKTRRGRPTCHVAHGEATAILAAFALQNRAFEILAEGWPGGPDAAARARGRRELARAIGTDGMIAGQARRPADDRPRDRLPDARVHPQPQDGRAVHGLGRARARGRARASPAELAAVVAYAKNLGLAFQIVDDLIDVTGRRRRPARTSARTSRRRPSCRSRASRARGQLAARAGRGEPGGARAVRRPRPAAARARAATSSRGGGRLWP